jgi:hypothetical protein
MPEAGRAPLPLLAELREPEASGAVRHIYGEIKRLCAVPMVALIYRHLATIPGALEWSWAVLEPVMRAGLIQQQAWHFASAAVIPRDAAIPRAALRAAGLGASDERAIAAVLDAYNRANPVNLMAVRCLALHLAGNAEPAPAAAALPAWQPPAPLQPLPPMIDPQAMTPTVRELALLLTDRGSSSAPSTLWPSLYRHLAHWPAFLGYASVLVPPHFPEIDTAATRLRQQIDKAAAELARCMTPPRDLPAPAAEQRVQLQAAIDQFSPRIPEMVVIGGLLRRALPSGPPIQHETPSEH